MADVMANLSVSSKPIYVLQSATKISLSENTGRGSFYQN